jgi:MOSC domain-containing protein YiiM
MEPTAKIISLQRCPGYRKPMELIHEAECIENLGIKDDRHALPDSSRQVLLVEKETLDVLGLKAGQVKENITTQGIELMQLPFKQRLKIGSEVILEITKACSPCSRMEEIRKGLMQEIAGRRGMLARVVTSGIIRIGDSIELLMRQP